MELDPDELSFNVFYLLLRNQFRKKYDFALTKCWTICVPCGDTLRDIPVTKEFVDDHILKPLPDSNVQFTSTDEEESHSYKIEDNMIKLINDDEFKDDYKVNILSIEKGYNKEFQPYNIIIVDKPLHRKYKIIAKTSESDKLQLNRTISSYRESRRFLMQLAEQNLCSFDNLVNDVEEFDVHEAKSVSELKQSVEKLIRDHWADTMRKQSLDIQRDARFQKLLSLSLEIYVMHNLHDDIYAQLSTALSDKDFALKMKIDQLIEMGVTPDQLGVRESLAVALPSALVELATLNSRRGPYEKLLCVKGTLDFIVAEIKGAIADLESRTDMNDSENSYKSCMITADDLIPLLLYIIVKCKSQKLFTDLYYIHNFIWSISPNDDLSYTMVTYKAALTLLDKMIINDLPESSGKVKTELKMGDLLMNVVDASPAEMQLIDVFLRLEECTQNS